MNAPLKARIMAGSLISLYLLLGYVLLPDYFHPGAFTLLGLGLAPYLFLPNPEKRSFRYSIPLLLLLLLAWFIPTKTWLFLALLCGLLLLLESSYGQLHVLFPALLFLLSPACSYLLNTFSFQLRVMLSQLSAYILNTAGNEAGSAGNVIFLNGEEFSVDPACSGLQMLGISFLITLFVMAYLIRQKGVRIGFFRFSALLLLTLGLNLCANLFRILILILFRQAPDTLGHELVGLLSFCVYVLIPLLLLAKLGFRSHPEALPRSAVPVFDRKGLLTQLLALGSCLLLAGLQPPTGNTTGKPLALGLEGYQQQQLKNGVLKLEHDSALIYVKPLHFYNAEHNPMICWEGSGYQFLKVTRKEMAGRFVYQGILQKDQDIIHTAWWFQNPLYTSIDQWEWRWKAITEKDNFCLINVNAQTEEELHTLISQITNPGKYSP